MKRFAQAVLVLLAVSSSGGLPLFSAPGASTSVLPDENVPCAWVFVRVIDGDTFQMHIPCLPPALARVAIRVRGIDTPERGAKARCADERRAAEAAAAFTTRFLMLGTLQLENLGWDKYGGRIDADVSVDGQSLGAALRDANLAKTCSGGPRPDWCGVAGSRAFR